jgi:hypothetical protein
MMRMCQIERNNEVQTSLSRALDSFVAPLDKDEDVLNFSDIRNSSVSGIKVSLHNMMGLNDSHRNTYAFEQL